MRNTLLAVLGGALVALLVIAAGVAAFTPSAPAQPATPTVTGTSYATWAHGYFTAITGRSFGQ